MRRPAITRATWVAVAVLAAIVGAAIFAPVFWPWDPARQLDIEHLRTQAPSWAHPFGTDAYSRDVAARVLYGARVSLGVGVLSVLLAATVGTGYGLAAALGGRATDAVLMRTLDALMSIPRVLFLLALLASIPHLATPWLVVVLGATGWFALSRLVRGEARVLGRTDFAVAARALGVGPWRLAWRHLLPNVAGTIIVATVLGVGNAIALEAGLSYLGLGVQPPTPSWGNLIHDGVEILRTGWWVSVFPAVAVVATVLSINAVGDALERHLAPRRATAP